MKTLTKNRGIMTATVALLMLSAMLITGCSSDITAEKPYAPPPGMGAVKLSFNNTVNIPARTILPGTQFGDFKVFDLTFEGINASTGTNPSFTNISAANINKPIELPAGEYDLTIVAYIDLSGTEDVATGTLSGLTITAGTLNAAPKITLVAYDPGTYTGQGIFEWAIDNQTTPTTATMTITEIGQMSPEVIIDLKNGGITNAYDDWSASYPLAAGYYYVDFEFVANSKTINFRQVLHIYQYMTSSYSYTLNDDYFGKTRAKLVEIELEEIADYTPELTFPVDAEIDDDDDIVVLYVSLAKLLTENVVITASHPDSLKVYSSVDWVYYDGTGYDSVGGLSDDGGVADDTLTLDSTNAPFDAVGDIIMVTVTGTYDSKEYTTVFGIKVDP